MSDAGRNEKTHLTTLSSGGQEYNIRVNEKIRKIDFSSLRERRFKGNVPYCRQRTILPKPPPFPFLPFAASPDKGIWWSSLRHTLTRFFYEQRCRACSAPFTVTASCVDGPCTGQGHSLVHAPEDVEPLLKKSAQSNGSQDIRPVMPVQGAPVAGEHEGHAHVGHRKTGQPHEPSLHEEESSEGCESTLCSGQGGPPFFNGKDGWDELTERGVPHELSAFFCSNCLYRLQRRTAGYCPECGELSPWPLGSVSLCSECLQHPRAWNAFYFYGSYSGLLRELLLGLKFGHKLFYGKLLGKLLSTNPLLQDDRYDIAVPVPLHYTRLHDRGYNQSLEIARGLAQNLGYKITLAPFAVERTIHGPPHSSLKFAERQGSIKGAFKLKAGVQGKRVLIIDDVLTTGSTVEELAKTLLEHGAAFVGVAVVARTGKHI